MAMIGTGNNKAIMAGFAKPLCIGALAGASLLAGLLLPAPIVLAQQPNPPSSATTAAPTAPGQPAQSAPPLSQAAAPGSQAQGPFPAQPPPPEQQGFIYVLGHWLDGTKGKIDDLGKQSSSTATSAAAATQDALKHAAEATAKAAGAIAHLPIGRFVEVHERCGIAPNGAPDCRTAAAAACRGKGFADGSPVNVQSSENCPPAIWMSGREPRPGECPQETVVLMAACR
jgi:hypothetical protein